MAMPTPKELKKIAKACREAGIKRYKGDGFELEFTDEALAPKPRKGARAPVEAISAVNEKFTTDTLTEEELLMWSTGGGRPFEENIEDNA